jgi:hypothetical protein
MYLCPSGIIRVVINSRCILSRITAQVRYYSIAVCSFSVFCAGFSGFLTGDVAHFYAERGEGLQARQGSSITHPMTTKTLKNQPA